MVAPARPCWRKTRAATRMNASRRSASRAVGGGSCSSLAAARALGMRVRRGTPGPATLHSTAAAATHPRIAGGYAGLPSVVDLQQHAVLLLHGLAHAGPLGRDVALVPGG